MKIYVHNFFSNILFNKLAHNTTNHIFDIVNDIGSIFCYYNDIKIEFIFNPKLSDEVDGYHLLDFFTLLLHKSDYNDFKDIVINKKEEEDVPFLIRISELLKNRNGWVLLFLRTEKILSKTDVPDIKIASDLDKLLSNLDKHFIVSDNTFLNDDIAQLYPNHFYAFSNSIYQWNELLGIRWFYEFYDIFKKINKDYDLGYSVKRQKKYRKELLTYLSNQTNSKIYLSFSDLIENNLDTNYEYLLNLGINFNSKKGNDSFSDIRGIPNIQSISLDLFFRILPKSKMQILDESWAWLNREYTHQYISEKTIGYILAGIPFISTHTYPLDILNKILKIEPHPFYDEFKRCNSNPKLFSEFVYNFMNNFDYNYKVCEDWSEYVRNEFIKKLNMENSLIDILSTDISIINKKIRII